MLGDVTLFEATLRRLRGLAPAQRTWVVTSQELGRVTRRELRRHPNVRLLLEPEARNTAAAILWAAARVAAEDPGALLGVFPADHHIPSDAAFARSVRAAARAAASGEWLVLVGIEPRSPDPAYGYIQLGDRARGGGTARRVRRFVEKPDAARARRFARSGRYLWNAGMLLATPERILAEAEAFAPGVMGPLRTSLDKIRTGRRVPKAAFARAYRRVAPLSFDHAVLEHTRRVLAVRGRFAWSDLGSWNALEEHLPQTAGNAVGGSPAAALVASSGNVIWNTTDKAVALLGVRDLVVVETQDALLVCSKDRAQEVRQVVGQLARAQRRDLT